MRWGRHDAWIAAAYLATLLIWPFYDQMGRFLFPILPVLVLYAFWTLGRAMRAFGRRVDLVHGLLAVLLLSLTLPALAFLAQRAGVPERYAQVVDWYSTPDLSAARARARRHLDLFDDMQEIGRLTRPGDRVMWFAPSYIALLADRHGLATPDPSLPPSDYRRAVRESGADYVFLSRYHPRDTIRTRAWQAGTAALLPESKAVHVRSGDGGAATSILLKMRE